ncbi:WD40 repeat domain-containing serine/threonine protein kinase [Actinocorallia aurantiaca]|uniref:Protein kinase domain-containing protein n=1 Tax=Actinocorallia aurantiaca TaxID=46204 RepID=A0ABN3UFC6_9ACTN
MKPGVEVAGRYRLEHRLGAGSFGEVWRAVDVLRERPVAVKFLHREVADNRSVMLSKFRQEAKIAARLEHPGITRVDDFGTDQGRWFLVMEFLDGRDLAEVIAEHPGGLPLNRALELSIGLVEGLAAAHRFGVVHRDLKPANVMVLPDDRVKICDFGIARLADASTMQTLTGRRAGTPAFMAPEQWLGQDVDHRTDLYAVGGIVFALLAGRPPFAAESSQALMGQHLNMRAPRVRSRRSETPPALGRLVGELLAKKPGDRPAETAEVLSRLEHIRTGLTPPASQKHDPAAPTPQPEPVPRPSRSETTGVRPGWRTSLPPLPRRAFLALAGTAVTVTAVTVVPSLLDGGPANSGKPPPPGNSTAPEAFGEIRLVETLTGHKKALWGAAFSPDGSILATAGYDHTAKLWNAETGAHIATLTGPENTVMEIGFSPDSSILVTAGDRMAKLWNAKTGALITTLTGHQGYITQAKFNSDSSTLATTGDRMAKLWDAKTGALITTLNGYDDPISAVVFSRDGSTLATAGEHAAKLWNAKTGAPVTTLTGHQGYVTQINFSPDGSTLATVGSDHTVKLWNAKTRDPITTLTGHKGYVTQINFSPDGSTLATVGSDHTVKLWNAKTGAPITTINSQKKTVARVAFSSDGSTLAIVGDDTIKLWNAKADAPITTINGHSDTGGNVVFNLNGSTLATTGPDYTVKLWNAETGAPVTTLTGHKYIVNAVEFGPDGSTIVTVGSDRTAKLWRT